MTRRSKAYRQVDLAPVIRQALAGVDGQRRADALRLTGHILSEIAWTFGETLGCESEPAVIVIDAAVEVSQHRIFDKGGLNGSKY